MTNMMHTAPVVGSILQVSLTAKWEISKNPMRLDTGPALGDFAWERLAGLLVSMSGFNAGGLAAQVPGRQVRLSHTRYAWSVAGTQFSVEAFGSLGRFAMRDGEPWMVVTPQADLGVCGFDPDAQPSHLQRGVA